MNNTKDPEKLVHKIVITMEIEVPFDSWAETVGKAKKFIDYNLVKWALSTHATTTDAAKAIGIGRSNLLRRCRELGLESVGKKNED